MKSLKIESSRIILNILMISLHHLSPLKENVPDSYVEILRKDLLTLLDLKDTDLVDWNFRNLKEEVIYRPQRYGRFL